MKSYEDIGNECRYLAGKLFDDNLYEKAIEQYSQAISAYEKSSQTVVTIAMLNCFVQRGIAYSILQKYPQALDDFAMVIERYNMLDNELLLELDLATVFNLPLAYIRSDKE